MAKPVFILNGPNLNMLGLREPEIYGRTTLDEIAAATRARAEALGVTIDFRQSNDAGTLIDWIQEAVEAAAAIVINPAGLSFRSIAILDALRIFPGPVIELHISNIHARDEAHRHSVISPAATAVIAGAGPLGYALALEAAVELAR